MTVIETETQTREADEELDALEALWKAPPAAAKQVRRRLDAVAQRALDPTISVLTWGWPIVLVSLFLGPEPDPGVAIPWWSWALFSVWAAAVLAMVLVAAVGNVGQALLASLTAASVGVGVGVACFSTEHHPGGWAMYELGAFSALALLSAGALAAYRAERPRG